MQGDTPAIFAPLESARQDLQVTQIWCVLVRQKISAAILEKLDQAENEEVNFKGLYLQNGATEDSGFYTVGLRGPNSISDPNLVQIGGDQISGVLGGPTIERACAGGTEVYGKCSKVYKEKRAAEQGMEKELNR